MTKILSLIENKSNYFLSLLLIIFLFTTFFSIHGRFWEGLKFSGFALTSDEVSHIPAGFYYLTTRKYFINAEHPPLIKDIAALPLLFLDLSFPRIPENLKYENIQWDLGSAFLFGVGNNPDLMVFCSRTIIILFNGLLLLLAYHFLKKIVGVLPSLLTLFFLVFSPTFIAHSSLVVFDIPLAFLCLLSISSFSLFLKDLTESKKGCKNLILSALFSGLALLSKFQAVFLIFGLFLGGLVHILAKKRNLWLRYILSFILFSLIALVLLGTVHGIQTTNMTVEGMQHQLGYSYPSEFPPSGKKILNSVLSFNIFLLNGIVEYMIGLFMIMGRAIGAAQATYFMGRVYGSEGAGPAYFPVLFLTKETLGFLILLFLVLFSSLKGFLKKNQIKKKAVDFLRNPFNAVSLIFFLIYAFFSLTLKLNIGLRHIFPITFLLYVLVAKKISVWLPTNISIFKKELKAHFILFPFFIAIIVAWITAWPYFLSYYNTLAGGTLNGYMVATDSNYDWGGQDVKAFAKWIKENDIEKIYAHIFSNVPLNYYLGEAYQYFNIKFMPLPPKGSLIAVSSFELQNVNYDQGLPESKKYSQLENGFIERIGTTIFIFQVR